MQVSARVAVIGLGFALEIELFGYTSLAQGRPQHPRREQGGIMSHPNTRRAALAPLLLLVALLAGPAQAAEWIYTVQDGDNPWNLTERYLAGIKYWPRIQTLNRIVDPQHIPPGTRLRIPVEWLRRVDAIAKVAVVHGEAQLRGHRASRPLSAGMQLRSGDVIQTGREANVTLEFADGSRVLVHAEAELHLDALGSFENTDYHDTQVRLTQGRMENLVAPLGKGPGRFEISTPAAVTAVRGTRYRVNAQADATRSEVLEGKVAVATAASGVDVDAGYGTVATATQAPGTPIVLLPAPALGQLAARVERVPVAFTIPALQGASAYRFQLASDASFDSLLFDGRAEGTRLRGAELPDGHYFLRVRGIDGQGLEGLSADHAFELDARPEPPLLTAPAPGAGVAEESPPMSWGESAAIARYRLQVARDEAFTDLLMDDAAITASHATTPQPLPPGIYYWRVASITDQEGQGPFSDTQQFRRLPPAPAMEAPAVDKENMSVRWRAGEPGQSFQFQLASEESFATPVIDMRVDGAEARFKRPKGGAYYMRVKTVDSDGTEGAFGTVQKIEVPAGAGERWWMLLFLPLIVLAL